VRVGRAARLRSAGFVLVGVLLVLLAIGVIAAAMSLEAGLATLGARSAAGSAAARPAARAALVLALDEALASAEAGAQPPPAYGPWAELGAEASAALAPVPGTSPVVYRLTATAVAGRSRAEASAAFAIEPAPRVLEWREP